MKLRKIKIALEETYICTSVLNLSYNKKTMLLSNILNCRLCQYWSYIPKSQPTNRNRAFGIDTYSTSTRKELVNDIIVWKNMLTLWEDVQFVGYNVHCGWFFFFFSKVGYEPLPPTLGRNIFGRHVYQLPGLFAYGEYIMYVFCK